MKINSGAESIANSLRRIDKDLANTRAQLSSGLKNPDPSTDPLASTTSKKLSAAVATAQTVQNIALTGKDTIELASGILQSNYELLHHMKDLAIQASNGTYDDGDRAIMDTDFQQHVTQFQANSQSQWGSRILFDGTFATNYQIGLPSTEILNVTFNDMTSSTVLGNLDVTSFANAQSAITQLATSLDTLSTEMSRLAAYSHQFDNTQENMEVNSLNLQSALSIYNDADFAEAITDSTRLGVLHDAASATLKMQFNGFEKLGDLVKESLRG
jgi:flagellin